MGTLSWSLVEEGSKMKLVAAACLVAAVFAEPEAKADADAALLYGGYGYTGLGYAGYGYGHYLGKRSADAEPEADAEADAALLYGGYGYTGLGYSGLGYAGLGYAGLGYGYGHYLGKRSADAEPKAEAEA